ncbi:MAG: electron transfer flavoprotein subunit beta/FixA family protein [Gaiellaceae bacterium]
MKTLVCVKRVPETGARITLTPDAQAIDTTYLGFTISPHEECAVEEAVRIGGETTVLTLGPRAAEEQLRNAMAMGIGSAVLLETDGADWGPEPTAAAISEAARGRDVDLLLFGNESADNGNYQIPVRVAYALGLPVVTGIKRLVVRDGSVEAAREAGGGWDVFELPLPAVVSVKEGINLPRYPSLKGRLGAKKAAIETIRVAPGPYGLDKLRLVVPQEERRQVEVLGEGAAAAPRVVEVLRELGLVAS